MIFRLRILAFLVDCIIYSVLFAVINIGFIIDHYMNADIMTKPLIILYLISFFAVLLGFILKDIFGGISVDKRVAKIKVVRTNGKNASLCRLILRNITIFIWPVEALLLLIGKDKIGDMIANTKVVINF